MLYKIQFFFDDVGLLIFCSLQPLLCPAVALSAPTSTLGSASLGLDPSTRDGRRHNPGHNGQERPGINIVFFFFTVLNHR